MDDRTVPDNSPHRRKSSMAGWGVAIFAKARTRGLGWLVRRIGRELRFPETRPGRLLRCASAFLVGLAVRSFCLLPALFFVPFLTGRKRLYVFYDLDSSPVTYDIIDHLMAAELERRRRGLTGLHVVFVPGRKSGLREEDPEYEKSVDVIARHARVNNILLPSVATVPSCDGHTLCSSRWHGLMMRMTCGAAFPSTYWPLLPTEARRRDVLDAARRGESVFPALEAPDYARAIVRTWLEKHAGSRKPIVISLREYAYMAARNSNRQAWVRFAETFDGTDFVAVFIPDIEASMPHPDVAGAITFEPGAWNVSLRLALYEQAYLNMAIAHGPMGLCWYSETARYVVFLPVGRAPQTEEDALSDRGLDPGHDLPFARPWQRIVWEEDTLQNIFREFECMKGLLDAESHDTNMV